MALCHPSGMNHEKPRPDKEGTGAKPQRLAEIIPAAGQMKLGLSVFILASSLLTGCASTGSNPVADMPSWMGGLPAGVPPRPGTAAYDAWQAERAKEAARPKGKDAAR